ncbi:winged helix DNA-binding domain-containing protein [bacterium]|nr:winged helix DNA-binding domain-containing protein [bacterium]
MNGRTDRRAVLDPLYANRICPGGNGVFYPTIVSQGQVVGTWTRTLKKNSVLVSAQPFTALSEDESRALPAPPRVMPPSSGQRACRSKLKDHASRTCHTS